MTATAKRSRSPRERTTIRLDNPYLDEFSAPPSEAEITDYRARFGNPFVDTMSRFVDALNPLHFAGSFFSTIRRDRLVSKYAWAIPTEEAVRRITKLSPICDLGCGTGYWAYLLGQIGAKVVAVDSNPPLDGANDYHHARKSTLHHWVPVVRGSASTFVVPRSHALMLCWPPYSTSMASVALRRYRGSRLIYIGEGIGGCTGDDAFHRAIAKNWKLCEMIDLPNWPGLHDSVHIYERRSRRAP
jgi:SAM-dependent methyltransferase